MCDSLFFVKIVLPRSALRLYNPIFDTFKIKKCSQSLL